MNCGGPSYFLKRPKSDSVLGSSQATTKPAKIAAIHQYILKKGRQTLEAIRKEEIPDACTIQKWLDNGSINLEVLEILKKNAILRRSRRTSVIPLSSRTHASLPGFTHCPPGDLGTCAKQSSCSAPAQREVKTPDVLDLGWPQESLKALNRWWFNGWWILGQFILHYAGGLLKNAKVDLH